MRYARSPRFALSLCVALLAMARAAGAVPITVNYNDGAGEGFNDTTAVAPIGGNPKVTLGEQRKFAFEFAMGLWSSALQGTVNIEIDATMDPLGGTATSAILGFGGSTTIHINFPGAPFANTFYSAALANQLSGGDVNGAGMAEIQITMNSDIDNSTVLGNVDWYYGTDANAGSDDDFVTVVLHELGHGLGFFSEVDGGTCIGGSNAGRQCGRNADCPGGTCDLSTLGTWVNGFPAVYDRFLIQAAATPPRFIDMTDTQRKAASTSGNVFWDGANVVAAHGGNAKIYAPNPWKPGSNISHWDISLTPNELHEPVYTGPIHNPGLSLAAFADEGWTVAPTTTTTTTTTTLPFGGEDPGCVPANQNRLKCGDTIVKAAAKLFKAVDKCHCTQAKARLGGVATANTDEEACEESNGGKAAKEKYDAVKAKLVTLGICTPTQLANMDTLRDDLLAYLDGGRNAGIYCDGSTPIGGDDMGNVPSSTNVLGCECSAGKNAAKLYAAALQCHFKNADSVFKQKVPPFNEEACEETSSPAGKGAHDKYTAAAAKLIAKGTCPPCLDSAAEHEALATADLGVAESKNDKPYPCE